MQQCTSTWGARQQAVQHKHHKQPGIIKHPVMLPGALVFGDGRDVLIPQAVAGETWLGF